MFQSQALMRSRGILPALVRRLLAVTLSTFQCVVRIQGFQVESCCSMIDLFTNSHFIACRNMEATVKHYHIKRNDSGQWYVAERHPFRSIPELIWYHQHNAAGKLEIQAGRAGEPGPRQVTCLWSDI